VEVVVHLVEVAGPQMLHRVQVLRGMVFRQLVVGMAELVVTIVGTLAVMADQVVEVVVTDLAELVFLDKVTMGVLADRHREMQRLVGVVEQEELAELLYPVQQEVGVLVVTPQ
jgi:hypothetical protein